MLSRFRFCNCLCFYLCVLWSYVLITHGKCLWDRSLNTLFWYLCLTNIMFQKVNVGFHIFEVQYQNSEACHLHVSYIQNGSIYKYGNRKSNIQCLQIVIAIGHCPFELSFSSSEYCWPYSVRVQNVDMSKRLQTKS